MEIPGGLISAGDADPMDSAVREMAEETGYTSNRVVHIGTVEPNPAIQTNRCHSYLALDCVQASTQDLDPTESVRVELLTKAEVYGMITQGAITHALVVAAFCFLLLNEARQLDPAGPLNCCTSVR